ncbi:MAG TPA: ArsA-related P-loop ATPase [Nocardioides sp.]|nr:ArsA-related P-loop ATPase [Nocardioides sp.]
MSTDLDVDALLADRSVRILVCCGAGGVGKTTTSAALALRAAETGRTVVVLTIDPARRLAQSLGIEQLDNVPRRVDGVGSGGGSLDAMMLDMKRTFDEVVASQSTPERAAKILANPFYATLSTSFGGTQEYMAMEKLGQLRASAGESGRWDLIVVDTPPARNALDFLDAPNRLSGFLDGPFIRLLLKPATGPARAMTAGVRLITATMSKVVGAQVLGDLQGFVQASDTLFGGFRARAEQTYALLKDRETAFLVVTAPQPEPLREASYFISRLREDDMPLAGVIVNRASDATAHGLSAEAAATAADRLDDGDGLAPGLLRLHERRLRIAAREAELREGFTAEHPSVAVRVVPALSADVHDLTSLRRIGEHLAGCASHHPIERKIHA